MGVAYEAVAQLSDQKIPLTWSDGRQIIADGAPVYAFNATKEQFNDSTLFNAAGTYGPDAVYEQWRQFGPDQTSQYSNELANISTYDSSVADAAERLSALAGKGIVSVSAIDDAILSLTGLRGGKVVVDAVLEVLTKRAAAKKAAADGAKGISITIEPKIADQMGKRGWTESSIQSVIDKPIKTVVTKDTRFDTVSGSRLNDPATGYIAKDGSYVVRNDRTGAIVQVSNKNDPGWVAPWD
nr:colicin E5-related ribonuclease [Pseudomonas sp. dw_612]